MTKAALFAVLLIGAAALAAALMACGDGSDDGSETPEPTAAGTATALPPGATGVRDLDRLIAAVLARDTETLASSVRLRPTACMGPTPASLGAFFCAEGEEEGTVIDVLPVAQCESHYTRRDELRQVFQFDATIALYAVYRSGDAYGVVFTQAGPALGLTVGVERGLITYIDYGCGQSAAQLVQNVAQEEFLIPPPAGD